MIVSPVPKASIHSRIEHLSSVSWRFTSKAVKLEPHKCSDKDICKTRSNKSVGESFKYERYVSKDSLLAGEANWQR